MINRLIACVAASCSSRCCMRGTTGSVRAQGPDIGTDAQRAVGQDPVSQELRAVSRRQRRRRRLRHAASLPQAAQLHVGQVQGSHDAQRRAADAPGSRQHHQARHALHLDACVASSLRRGSVGSRLLHQDFLSRLRSRRECPEAHGASERAGFHSSVDRSREEALRGNGLRQVPR